MSGRRRLSVLRLLGVLVAVAIIAGAGSVAVRRGIGTASGARIGGTWFAPYVDVTEPSELHFEDLGANPAGDAVLGFVVASRDGACAPTWGTYYDLDGAARSLDLDRRIERSRQRGDDILVSFGGLANSELATRCTSDDALRAAYAAVIRRYALSTIDFDVEGDALADAAANARRSRVVKSLQDSARASGQELAVWLTLPVATNGLSSTGLAIVDSMLAAKVDIAGVNVMAMDFGASKPNTTSMIDAMREALDATFRQLDGAYRRAGLRLSTRDLWRKVGITPMIGQNDVRAEQFTVEDARSVLALAEQLGLGRVSMWSANRDQACGAQLDLGTVSNSCSGVLQKPQEFGQTFSRLGGAVLGAAHDRTVSQPAVEVRDDPATSPYPIWDAASVYTAGSKVTWRRNVYEAKWWSRANVPDEPVAQEWDTPWRFLGPVMSGDRPASTTTLPGGVFPAWSRAVIYVKGDRVERNGVAYEARWWNRAEEPQPQPDDPYSTPWVRVDR